MSGPGARGFSLIELMVALVIGLLVSVGGMTFYSSTLKTRHTLESSLSLEENRHFAVQTLQRYLAQAGHRPLLLGDVPGPVLPLDSRADAFPATADGWAAGSYLRGAADSLTIRFLGSSDGGGAPDGSLSDCTGRALGAADTGEMTFRTVGGRLLCTASGVDVTLAGGDDDTRVTGMDVRFGVDDDGDGAADRFVTAGAGVPNTTVSLTMELALRSERQVARYGADAIEPITLSIALRN